MLMIGEYRRKFKVTQKELARELMVPLQSLVKWEKGLLVPPSIVANRIEYLMFNTPHGMMRRIRRYVRRHGAEATREIIRGCSQPERSELEKAFRAYRRETAC